MKHVGQRHAQCVNRTYRRTPGRCGRAASGRASCSSTGSSCGVSVISSSTRCARVWCCTPPITAGPAIARTPAMRHVRCSPRTPDTWRSIAVTRPRRSLIKGNRGLSPIFVVGQVTIHLDDETEKRARAAADADGVSLSKWISQRIQKHARAEWPAAVREPAGAWPDLPSAEQMRRASAKDVRRGRP
jgi:hypothetical protein